MGISFANAQNAKCSAVVTKQSISPDPNEEKTWSIQFNVNVSGCEASNGTFEYVAQLEARGRMELLTVSETFDTANSGANRFTVSFHAPPGKDLKDVKSATVKTCTCAS